MAHNNLADQIDRGPSRSLVVLATPSDPRWELRVDQIEPVHAHAARRYEESALDALATSIREWGQLQPILVRRVGSRYQVVCGERRWRAIQRAGLPSVWAVEHSATELQAIALRLAENLHHVSLSHAEKVAALDQLGELVGSGGLRETARQLGMDPSWLSRQLGIRRDPILFPALERGQIGFAQAAELRRASRDELPALLDRVLTSDSHVSTSTIRGWVAETRLERERPRERAANLGNCTSDCVADPDPLALPTRRSSFATLLEQVRALTGPSTKDERRALEEIASIAGRLLAAPRQQGKTARREVSCLMCGELAGLRDEGGVLNVTSRAGVQRQRGGVSCGRCGGALTTGVLEVHYRY